MLKSQKLQKAEEEKAFEIPKLRKIVEKPKEEVKEEPKKTKVKIPKAKKYEELPEIPDYDRPDLEKYEQIDLDPKDVDAQLGVVSKPEGTKAGIASQAEPEKLKNGLPKVNKILTVNTYTNT